MVIGERQGQYDRLVFRFDREYSAHDLRTAPDITPAGLNFVVLDTGVCVCLNEDEQLELFSARMGASTIKLLEDPALGGDMQLASRGGELLFSRGDAVFSMRMK